MIVRGKLLKIYYALLREYGPQNWWPADSPFEVMAGAILTQNANWNNVSKAIDNLKMKDLISPRRISIISQRALTNAVKPAGFYNQKAAYLKNLSRYLMKSYSGDIGKMAGTDAAVLRKELLEIKGLGPETADSILLYALGKSIFVIDAYTKRVFGRHGIKIKEAEYSVWQKYFESRLPGDQKLFNEYHALIVRLAKERCRKRPYCQGCPLEGMTI